MGKTRRIDVSCRIFFVAEIDETLLERGSGFLMHVLEQEALRIVKEGKRNKDFHLTAMYAVDLSRTEKQEPAQETTIMSEQKARYSVAGFSPGLDGIWDEQAGDFVKNPDSGRRRLFHRKDNAQKLCDKLNKEHEAARESEGH